MFTHYLVDYPSIEEAHGLVGVSGITFEYKMTIFYDDSLEALPDGIYSLVKTKGKRDVDRPAEIMKYLYHLLSRYEKGDRFVILSTDDVFERFSELFHELQDLAEIQLYPDLSSHLKDDFREIIPYVPRPLITYSFDTGVPGYIN